MNIHLKRILPTLLLIVDIAGALMGGSIQVETARAGPRNSSSACA